MTVLIMVPSALGHVVQHRRSQIQYCHGAVSKMSDMVKDVMPSIREHNMLYNELPQACEYSQVDVACSDTSRRREGPEDRTQQH